MDGSIETYLLIGFALSVLGSVGGIVVVEVVLVKLRADYFADATLGKPLANPSPSPLARRAGLFLKNVLGAALIVLGLVMAVPALGNVACRQRTLPPLPRGESLDTARVRSPVEEVGRRGRFPFDDPRTISDSTTSRS